MSSRTPSECVEIVIDSSASETARRDAIHALKRANECDELEAFVRNETLDEQLRREAVDALGTPQCRSTLRELIEEGSLDRPFREAASELLAGSDGD